MAESSSSAHTPRVWRCVAARPTAPTISAGVVVVILLAIGLAPALAGQASVRFHEGLVSATFEATPASEALDTIQRATGVELVVPPLVEGKTLTLTVEQLPFERFLQRVLTALDLRGFALVFGIGGAARQLIIVDRPGGEEARAGQNRPLTGGKARTGDVPAPVWTEKPR